MTYDTTGERTRFYYEEKHTPEENIAWLRGESVPSESLYQLNYRRTAALFLIGSIIALTLTKS